MKAIDLLVQRQSNAALAQPAPSEEHLDLILKAAMRVPDHGALTPWHFTIVKETGLEKLASIYFNALERENVEQVKLDKAKKMPFRAPMIITVSTEFVEHEKIPQQEQLIAAGCTVHAMQMAAFALGYGAIWRTGELSYNSEVKKSLNIDEKDEIVGFLYIGSKTKELPLKPNKSYKNKVTYL